MVLGIAIGDLLIEFVGTGAWQIGVIVAVAVTLALVLDGSSTLMTQAGGTAVLIVALSPLKPDLEVPRFVNAAVGGVVGLTVYLVLLPLHPLRLIDRQARPVFDVFAAELAAAAKAVSIQDLDGVQSALDRLRRADPRLRDTRDVVRTAMEVATLAPARRQGRPVLVVYSRGFDHLERALRNSRGNLRRIADMIRDNEPVPATLPSAMWRLGDAARSMHRGLIAGRSTQPIRDTALEIAVGAQRDLMRSPGPNAAIALAQVHTIVFDLLRASGAERSHARSLIRAARREAARE